LFRLLGPKTLTDEQQRSELIETIDSFAELIHHLDGLIQLKCGGGRAVEVTQPEEKVICPKTV